MDQKPRILALYLVIDDSIRNPIEMGIKSAEFREMEINQKLVYRSRKIVFEILWRTKISYISFSWEVFQNEFT